MQVTPPAARDAASTPVVVEGLPAGLGGGRKALILAGALMGMLLSALDQTVVGTAMPRVIAELGGMERYAWVFTGYMLTSTVSVPIYGKLSDIYGRRPFFLSGMVLFLAASALSGLSQDMTQLIAFRALQGLGAGAILPIVQAIIGDLFPPAERGKWQGLIMAVLGAASILGPLVGGFVTDNWGWRWTFYVNQPVGALALLTAGIALPKRGRRRPHRVDYLGAALLVAASTPLLLAFSWAGSDYPWASAQIGGLLALAVLMGALFALVETRAAEPIISPALLRNGVFRVSVIATFVASGGLYSGLMFLPLFVQAVIGGTATNAGAALTPLMLGFVTSSTIAGQIMARTGRYKALALTGFVIAMAGMLLLSRMDAATTIGEVVRNMVLTGFGLGMLLSLFVIVVQNSVPPQQLGQVVASLQFFRSIGATISVAVLGSLMTSRFQAGFQSNLPADVRVAVPPERLATLSNPQALLAPDATSLLRQGFSSLGPQGSALFDQVLQAIRLSLAAAIADLFLVLAGAMVLGFVATLFLPEMQLRGARRPSSNPSRAAEHTTAPEGQPT